MNVSLAETQISIGGTREDKKEGGGGNSNSGKGRAKNNVDVETEEIT